MFHAVLEQIHPMIGVEIHIVGGGVSMMILNGLDITADYAPTFISDLGFKTIMKGSDIGNFIPHVFFMPPLIPPWRYAFIIPFSSSKSHFGSATFKSKGMRSQAEVSVALALLVFVNPNLNCGEPVYTPTGFVIAPSTHVGGMTFGDFMAGLLNMAFDVALAAALRWATGKISTSLGNVVSRAAPAVSKAVNRLSQSLANTLNRGSRAMFIRGVARHISTLGGGPVSRAMFAGALTTQRMGNVVNAGGPRLANTISRGMTGLGSRLANDSSVPYNVAQTAMTEGGKLGFINDATKGAPDVFEGIGQAIDNSPLLGGGR